MENSVGIGVYHLHNSVKFTERFWREAQNPGAMQMVNTFSVGNFGLPFKTSRKSRKFSHHAQLNSLTIYIPTTRRGGGGGVLPHMGPCVGMVFYPFWSEIGYGLCSLELT